MLMPLAIMLGVLLVLLLMVVGILAARLAGARRERAIDKPPVIVGVPAPARYHAGVPAATRDRALELIGRGKVIQAIKEVRMDTGMGLKEAKDFVDALKEGRVPSQPVLGDATLSERVRAFKTRQDIEAAIALVRAETGMTRREAERFVHALD